MRERRVMNPLYFMILYCLGHRTNEGEVPYLYSQEIHKIMVRWLVKGGK